MARLNRPKRARASSTNATRQHDGQCPPSHPLARLPAHQIERLVQIAMTSQFLWRHDLNNLLTALAGASELLQHELGELTAHAKVDAERLNESRTDCEYMTTLVHALISGLDKIVMTPRTEALDHSFIVDARRSATYLRDRFQPLQITPGPEFPEHGYYVYPRAAFLAIATELVQNASKHSSAPPAIQIDLRTVGPSIILDVHDSGPGLSPALTGSPLPIDLISSRPQRWSGLSMVLSIVTRSSGALLFRRSSILGGTQVTLQLPVVRVAHRGRWLSYRQTYAD